MDENVVCVDSLSVCGCVGVVCVLSEAEGNTRKEKRERGGRVSGGWRSSFVSRALRVFHATNATNPPIGFGHVGKGK